MAKSKKTSNLTTDSNSYISLLESKKVSRIKYLSAFLSLIFTILLGFGSIHAQSSMEFYSGSIASIPTGPTTASQTPRLLLNSDNPTGNTIGATNTTINVTASLSNQQFMGVNTGSGNPVVMFGATLNSGGSTPVAQPTFGTMNTIGTPANTNFSNTTAGTNQGMDVTVNHAFNFFTSIRQWTQGVLFGDPATNARVRMADLTLTFSSPVTNPLIQVVGLGGTAATGQGFSTELTLTTPGLTLTKLQGNTSLAVTATQMNNNNGTIASGCTATAGCGTVRINGSNITTITFQVFVRGDGGSLTTWSNTATHPGDQWMLAVSLPEAYDVSGNVFNDSNGLSDGTVNGTGINDPSGVQLYANLVDPTDSTVIGSVPVAADGTYILTGVPGSGVNYRIDISTNQGTPLAAAPGRALPTAWNYVGDNLGSGAGSDGTPNGALTVAVSTSNLSNANFGINVTTAAGVSVSGRVSTAGGNGIRNVIVNLQEADGTVHTVATGSFGSFRFDDILAGQSVVISIYAKRYTFKNPARIVSVNDELADVDFVANE